MHKQIKIFSMLFLLSSSAAFADGIINPKDVKHDQCCENLAVSSPVLGCGLQFAIEALWWRPSNSVLDYASVAQYSVIDMVRYDKNIKTVAPSYQPGFRVGLAYSFAKSNNDIQLNWTHFQKTYSSVLNSQPYTIVTTMFGVLQYIQTPEDIGEDIAVIDDFKLTTKTPFRYNAVDLDFGHFVDLWCKLHLRVFEGLRLAYLSNNITNYINAAGGKFSSETGDFNAIDALDNETSNSKFTGAGPRIGVESSYDLICGLSLVGNIAGSLLYGSAKTNLFNSVHVTDGPQILNFLFTMKSPNCNRVVPNIDLKLGLNYAWGWKQMSFNLEAGYKLTHYFDVIDRIIPDFNTLSTDILLEEIPNAPSYRTTSGVGFEGPYLLLNFRC